MKKKINDYRPLRSLSANLRLLTRSLAWDGLVSKIRALHLLNTTGSSIAHLLLSERNNHDTSNTGITRRQTLVGILEMIRN